MSQIKVLHIDTEMSWRGGENQIKLLLEHAQNNGVEWHLAAPPESQAIIRMAKFARTFAVPMKGLKQITAAKKIADYCRQNQVDLVDCQSSRAHQLGLLVKYIYPKIKLVVHRRVDYAPGSSGLNRFKYINPKIDQYIAISEAIKEILIKYGVPKEQITTVRSAVDRTPFENINRRKARENLLHELSLTIPESTPIIGNIAYITEQKGHQTLVRALGLLKDQNIPFFAFIAGDGDLRAANEALANELNLTSHLKFLGIRKDVPELLAASDIFALSSNDEGLGTSLLDATHSGCCLVGTKVGGIPEVILHQTTGLLSPARDHAAFAENLKTVLQNSAQRLAFVKNAQAHVNQHFSLEQMVDGNLRIYRSLTQRS